MTTETLRVAARRPLKAPRSKTRRRQNLLGLLFLAPAIVLIGVFTIAPFGQAILLSFQSWDGISPDTPFIGVENYLTVFQDQTFWASMGNALVFAVIGLFVGGGLALVMAILVNNTKRAKAFFRTAFYLPGIFSVVVIGLMFSWMFDPKVGILNRILDGVGLGGLEHNWLGDPATALASVAAVFVWYHWGFAFILFLAGLQDIPSELYEAASLDGARIWAKFRYVTWPHLAPVTSIVTLLTLLAALQIFGTVQVLTGGGPGYHTMVPTLLIYNEAFTNHQYGVAAAMSVLFGGALVILSMVQLTITRRRARA